MSTFPITFLLLFLLLSPTTTLSSDPTSFIYSTCSKSQFPPNSPYQYNLNSLLSSLSSASSFSLFSQFSTPPPSISGLFQCTSDLSLSLCSSCLRSAASRLPSLCPSSVAASIQLRACLLRYANDTFLGRPDTALRYKTCSTEGNGGGAGFLAARDEALDEVAKAPMTGSGYRMAAAGAVRAAAQCVGDLSVGDCDGCVRAAAAQVKVSCGGAAAGEVYLGKCFLWYSGGGVPYGGGGGGGGGHGGGNNDNDVEKTVAIMIGIIALIVFIVICLYYLKRKAKGKH